MKLGIGIEGLRWVWQSLTTRCPHCRYGAMFYAYEEFSVLSWNGRAQAVRCCPKCGYDPDPGREREPGQRDPDPQSGEEGTELVMDKVTAGSSRVSIWTWR